jgi:hypothetical protein
MKDIGASFGLDDMSVEEPLLLPGREVATIQLGDTNDAGTIERDQREADAGQRAAPRVCRCAIR